MIYKIILVLLGLPKSLYFNIKYFGFRGLRLPVFISPFVFLKNVGGSVQLSSYKSGTVKIGFPSVGIFDEIFSRSIWQVSGVVKFAGRANLGGGTKFSVGKNGRVYVGNRFTITAQTEIISHLFISIGDDVLIAWDNLIMDTDFHQIHNKEGDHLNEDKKIVIGNNVWIGCRNIILKGSEISNGSVLGSGSTLTKSIKEENVLIVGNPAKIVKKEIEWKK